MVSCHTDFRIIVFEFYLLPEMLCSHNQSELQLLVVRVKLATVAVLVMLGCLILSIILADSLSEMSLLQFFKWSHWK